MVVVVSSLFTVLIYVFLSNLNDDGRLDWVATGTTCVVREDILNSMQREERRSLCPRFPFSLHGKQVNRREVA